MACSRFGNLPFLAVMASLCLTFPVTQAYAQYGGGDWSTSQQAPAAPADVQILNTAKGAKLTWANPKNSNVTEFSVYRLENYAPDKTLKLLAVVPRNQSTPAIVSYYDATIEPKHMYTYFLTAKDAFSNKSGNSKMIKLKASP